MIKVDRKKFIKKSISKSLVIVIGVFGLLFFQIGCNSEELNMPNILLIMADDMGFSDLGCYGSEISTPNIDRLAYEGIRFTQFYNAARCCPTRASLLTGLYPHQTGMGGMVRSALDEEGPYQGYLNNNCVTLAEVLKTAKYKTYMSGKWHVGDLPINWPNQRGFDKYYGLISGGMNYFDISKSKRKGLKRVFSKDGELFDPPTTDFYVTDAFTDEALMFLNDHDDSPFFMYMAYNAPHWPLHAKPKDIEKYKGKYLNGWKDLRKERYKKQIEMGLINPEWELSQQDPRAMDWEDVKDKEKLDLKMAIYAAQIESMDENIGRILKKLREMNQLDNTLIIFLSDNGGSAETGALGFDARGGWDGKLGTKDSYSSYGRSWSNASNTPFRLHKKRVHEGGIATPFIARYPKLISGNQITNQVGHIIDVMATIIDLSHAEYPTSFGGKEIVPPEGKSLLPIFKGIKRESHNTLFWEHQKNKAIRKGDWKLVSISDGTWELYNLKKDRTEINNLVDEYPELVQELILDYTLWAKKCGVKL